MRRILLPVLLLGSSVVARGQDPVLPMPSPRGVHVGDPMPDGWVWVRGDRYKLGLGAAVTFQPLFGPAAPRDWPLTLHLAAPAAGDTGDAEDLDGSWRIDGHRAERRRGAATERWDFAAGHAQQSFVLERPWATGDLTLAVAVATDLRPEPEGPGVTFVAPDGLGSVHYSDAVVIDAAGERIDVPVEWAAAAQWPLVVDPWLHTIVVDGSVSDMQDAKVAYDETNDVWLVVAEEVLSATDSDIVTWRYSAGPGAPVLLDTVYAHNSPQQTINPDVASMTEHGLFVVAWYNTTDFGATIGGLQFRRRSASSTSATGILTTTAGFGSDPSNRALVGGSRTGALFALATMMRTTAGNPMVQLRVYDVGGVAYGTHQFGLPAAPVAPAGDLSMRQGAADPWVLVWEECEPGCATTRIQAKALTAPQNAGGFTVQPVVTVASGTTDFAPRIAGENGRWLVVWQRNTFRGGWSVLGQPLHAPGGTLALLGAVADMHAGEPNSVPALRRGAPAISFDGVRHVLTYDEESSGMTEPFAMTVLVDSAGGIAWHDGRVALGIGLGAGHRALDVAASTGPHLGRHLVMAQRPTTNGDLHAAVVDAYAAGVSTSVADLGCGLPSEPTIGLTGTPALGRTFTVSLGNVLGAPFLLIGAPSVSPLPGCGSCQQGVALAGAVTVFGTSTSITVPGDPSFLHLPLGFQGITMLQPGGCPAAVFGVEFALSDALSVQIL
jgi:hypothetical protein